MSIFGASKEDDEEAILLSSTRSDKKDSISSSSNSNNNNNNVSYNSIKNNNENPNDEKENSSNIPREDQPIEEGNVSTNILKSKHYPLWVAICFALNYAIGSGVLGLPYEYYKTGYVLSTFIMIWMGILAYCTYQWIVDAMIRASAIKKLYLEQNININTDTRGDTYNEAYYNFFNNPSIVISQLKANGVISIEKITRLYNLNKIEFELNEVIGIFCGRKLKIIYEILFTMAMIMELWSYIALFGASLARHIDVPFIGESCDIESDYSDECRQLYSFWVVLFWIWIIIMTNREFANQQFYQVFSSITRFVIIIMMLITTIGLMYSNFEYVGEDFEITHKKKPHYGDGIEAFKWNHFLQFFAIASFAYGNQFCVTEVVKPLRHQDREKQHALWGWNIGLAAFSFIICGLVMSLYFGSSSESPCTLAWTNFRGLKEDSKPVWALVLSWLIVLFPGFDMLSAFPLNAISTANTIEAALLDDSKRYTFKWKFFSRFTLCTITSGAALLIWNFDFIVLLTGSFLLISLYGGCTLLIWYSCKTITEITENQDAWITFNTEPYIVSSTCMIVACGLTTVVAFIGCIIELCQDPPLTI